MNPYDEQTLRDEVIYLHSLWHQGRSRHNPNPNNASPTLRPSTKRIKIHHNTYPRRDSGPAWLVAPIPSPPPVTTGWPDSKPKAPPREPVSEQEQAKLLALQLQKKAVERCRKFFVKEVDDKDHEEKEEEEEDYFTQSEEETEEYRFLLDVFVDEEKLRNYYESSHENGEFCCLICGGSGEKVNKRYKGCLALVQHATTVSKTKRKTAHRAFGRVVCKVLGWDFDRLPVVVLKGDPLGTSSANLIAVQGEEAKGIAENDKEDMTVVVEHNEGSLTENNREIVEKEVSDVGQKDGEMKVCEVDDASKCDENLDGKLSNVGADKEVAVECQDSSLVANTGWSCTKTVDELSPIASGWPTFKPKESLVIESASVEDQEKLAALKLQHKVSEFCREYFEKNVGSEGDEDDNEGDNLMGENESEDSEDFKFYLKIFSENSELRNYYEKNYEAGEFCCLVCGGIGEKVWKRFKNCRGLLQHSTAISKTKKKQAHRAFGQVLCKVLGWDVDRLPMIVSKGEPLGQSLVKSCVLQGGVGANAEGSTDEVTAPKNNADCELDRKVDYYFHQSNGALIISKNSSVENDTSKQGNDTNKGILDIEGNKDGATDVSVS